MERLNSLPLNVSPRCQKIAHDDEDSDLDQTTKSSKAKRHDIEPPTAEVDLRLAEKLDNLLKISGDSRKPKFLTNRPRASPSASTKLNGNQKNESSSSNSAASVLASTKLKRRNLTKEKLQEIIRTRYETLVPESDPERVEVKVVKLLSVSESLELGTEQAKKQMQQQLEIGSVSGNLAAHQSGNKCFMFNDGYEMPMDDKGPMKSHRRKNPIAGAGNGSKLLAQKDRQVARERLKREERIQRLAEVNRADQVSDSEPDVEMSHERTPRVKFNDDIEVEKAIDYDRSQDYLSVLMGHEPPVSDEEEEEDNNDDGDKDDDDNDDLSDDESDASTVVGEVD